MGTFTSFRKAYGALKDSTKVGLAKVNSEFKELDIAIVKATNHVESPPKERHVRRIFSATSAIRPRADVAYCIHALAKRLSKTKNWIVALKVLIVFHRTLREGDPTFREDLMTYSQRGNVLQISYFKDDSSPMEVDAALNAAWDCSAWVRTYALFLEERLECFRVLKYDIEAERLTKCIPGESKVHSRTRQMSKEELLEHLPALQQLLYRLMGCQPEGSAYCNYLVQYALALVLKESFKIYCAINDGIINLVDSFFEMPRHDAIRALDIYKTAGKQAESLSEFYDYCKGLDLARNFQFPTLRQPPPSFLSTMEEYIKEAPHSGSAVKRLEYRETDVSPEKAEENEECEAKEANYNGLKELPEKEEETTEPVREEAPESPPMIATDGIADLLGLSDEVDPRATQLEQSNALALAIVQPGTGPETSSSTALNELGTTGWELALVTTPSNTSSNRAAETKMAGGFDKLLLDSLYEDEAARKQIQYQNAGYGGYVDGMTPHNPFDQSDPFLMSNSIAPPPNVQMSMLAQQHQMMMHQQQNYPMSTSPYGCLQPQYQQQQMIMHQQVPAPNPFGDAFPQSSAPNQGPNMLL